LPLLIDNAWLQEKIAADRDVDQEAGIPMPLARAISPDPSRPTERNDMTTSDGSGEALREKIARLEADLALSESMRVAEHAELIAALEPFAKADEFSKTANETPFLDRRKRLGSGTAPFAYVDHQDFETARSVFERAARRRRVRLP
jgi:hypothetical protein